MSSPKITCHNCGSSDFESDPSRGDTVCIQCGIVIEDNAIINEIQFEEGVFGGTHVVGQRVSEEFGMRGLSSGGMMGTGKQSRQITLENAKRKIKTVGNQLNLNTYCVDQAFSFYKMALNRRLTHGRKNSHVIAACVYMTCRLELTPHILLDLSDVMQVNVYELGRTYLKLSSVLCINIPPIDPCIYILRYAYKLGLNEKSKEVQMTALRLVSRMKRDWMHTGRRPSGLCGAALLVSARLHGLHCSIKDVIKVVKVCETTIRKRLNEFGDTPSSKLTLDEFLTVDLEGEEDPPCYKFAKKKFKEGSPEELDKAEVELKEELSEEIEQLQKKIDEAIEKSRKKLKGPYAKLVNGVNCDPTKETITPDENEITRQIIQSSTVETIQNVLIGKEESNLDSTNSNSLYFEKIKTLRPTVESLGLVKDTLVKIDAIIPSNNNEELENSLEIKKDDEKEKKKESGELYFDDLDDEELDSYLLNSKEIETKTNYWLKYHADYLKEMEEKEKRKKEEEDLRKEREANGEISPKKKRKSRKKIQIEASSAGEAIEKMLHEKKISNKINYEVLKKLTTSLTDSNDTTKNECDEIKQHLIESNSSKRLPSMRSQINLSSFSKLKTSTEKPVATSSKKVSETNLPKEEIQEIKKSSIAIKEIDDVEDEEDDDDDYYDVHKEKSQLSIAGLMGAIAEDDNHYGMEDDYEYDYFEDE